MRTDIDALLRTLYAGGVEFIVIGGIAGALHGAARVTYDVDVVYRRTPENIRRLVAALRPFEPYLRGALRGLPFRFDEPTVKLGLNFTLQTTIGDLDVLGEVAGGGFYEDPLAHSVVNDARGYELRVVDLPTLIHIKRAAGRPEDFEAIAELEAILEERGKLES
jgi:hypothetical protein